ncbi:unnamed protein product [Ilex paraguariensis]|uniref:TRASH domain-containing protein n=1 Tax=Ilex paraguariensis TaxID=185542 RepID=A0ABC8TLZ9_9AQUA
MMACLSQYDNLFNSIPRLLANDYVTREGMATLATLNVLGKAKGYPVWGAPNRVEPFMNEKSPPPVACPSIVNSKALGFPVSKLTELCRFSGTKIYPGKGIRFVCSDSQVFLFANSKCKRYFHNRLKPTWTAMYRKRHKKDIAAETVKKRRRTSVCM